MSDNPGEGTVQPESGLTDDSFSPVWADDDRPRIPRVAAEREALAGYLEYYRGTVEMKCRGLTPEQARTRSMPPSSLSLHGLVRHLAGVERWWFRIQFAGEDVPLLYYSDDDPDQDFESLDGDVEEAFATWHAECRHSRQIVATAASLDQTGIRKRTGEPISLRRILVDTIAEYARHNGHADLLRERLDGSVGM